MTAVALAAIILAAGLGGVVTWLTYRYVTKVDDGADARVAQVATEAEFERAQFERDVTAKALAAEKTRSAALEQELAHDLADPYPDAPADPADVRGRLLRLSRAWGDAGAGGPLPAGGDDAVPADAAASASDAARAGR